MQIKFKKLSDKAEMPRKAHPTDAAFDLVATSRVFDAQGNATYGTGIAVEIPYGYAGFIFPRSSIARTDLALSNAVGLIDSSFRGEILCKFKPTLVYIDKDSHGEDENDYDGTDQTDLSTQDVTFHGRSEDYPDVCEGYLPFRPRVYEVGERIAQILILPLPEVYFIEAETLSETDRGAGGYGSTGK